jgi:hypothetical protein
VHEITDLHDDQIVGQAAVRRVGPELLQAPTQHPRVPPDIAEHGDPVRWLEAGHSPAA